MNRDDWTPLALAAVVGYLFGALTGVLFALLVGWP